MPAIDQAVVGLGDDEYFLADARAGRAIGYQGKICIHPRQVELAHEVFTPAAEEVAHAEAVLAAGEAGVGVVDGQMVDSVHVKMARSVLARVGRAPSADQGRCFPPRRASRRGGRDVQAGPDRQSR